MPPTPEDPLRNEQVEFCGHAAATTLTKQARVNKLTDGEYADAIFAMVEMAYLLRWSDITERTPHVVSLLERIQSSRLGAPDL